MVEPCLESLYAFAVQAGMDEFVLKDIERAKGWDSLYNSFTLTQVVLTHPRLVQVRDEYDDDITTAIIGSDNRAESLEFRLWLFRKIGDEVRKYFEDTQSAATQRR